MYQPPFHKVLEEAMKDKKEKRKLIGKQQQGPRVLPYRRFDTSLPALYREDDRNAGYDLFARVGEEGILINPGELVQVPLNVATEIPVGGVGLLFQRSSTRRKWGVRLTNNVGVIDALFAGDGDEWKAEFINETDKPVVISHGDKICQAVFLDTMDLHLYEREELGNEDRGGFGTSFDNASDIERGE
jgi:dUTP pyrophosphatase